jgi:putative acetyltransferase
MRANSLTQDVRIVDLDTYEPTDVEIVSWYEMMTAPDQLLWEYDVSWAKKPTTPEKEIKAFRQRRFEQRGKNHPFWAFARGKVVGMIGLNRFDAPARGHCAELGYGVAAAFTRRGIGSRLFAAAIEKAQEVGVKRLEVDCFEDNAASIALIRKFGFQEEGLRIGAICKDGKLRNMSLFGLMLLPATANSQ